MIWRLPDRKRSRQGILAAALVAACLSTTWAALAAEPTAREKARELLAQGAGLLEAGDAAGALSHFQAAQATYPNPKIQYNLALALERVGRPAQALTALERFLREAQDAPPDHVAHARVKARELSGKVGTVLISSDVEGAEALIDGVSVGLTPLAGRLPVEVGRHELVVRSARSGSRSRSFTAAAGRPLDLRIDFHPVAGKAAAAAVSASDPARREQSLSGAPRAEALIRQATDLRKAGKDSRAYPLFHQAYEAETTPRTAAQLGLVEMQLGYWLDAERHLAEGLASPRDPWIASNRVDLESSLARVKAAIGEVIVARAPSGAEVLVNGKPAGVVPLAAPVRVGEGPVNIEVRAPGHPSFFRSLIVLGGQREEIVFGADRPLQPSPSTHAFPSEWTRQVHGAPLGPPADDGRAAADNRIATWARPLAWTSGGLALGALSFAVYETATWRSKLREFESFLAPPGSGGLRTCGVTEANRGAPGCAPIYSDFQGARTLGIASYVAAGVLGAAAGVLFIVSSTEPSGSEIACALTLNTAGATCRYEF